MVSVGFAVYVALMNSSEVWLFHARTHQQLAKADIRLDVKNMLSGKNLSGSRLCEKRLRVFP